MSPQGRRTISTAGVASNSSKGLPFPTPDQRFHSFRVCDHKPSRGSVTELVANPWSLYYISQFHQSNMALFCCPVAGCYIEITLTKRALEEHLSNHHSGEHIDISKEWKKWRARCSLPSQTCDPHCLIQLRHLLIYYLQGDWGDTSWEAVAPKWPGS